MYVCVYVCMYVYMGVYVRLYGYICMLHVCSMHAFIGRCVDMRVRVFLILNTYSIYAMANLCVCVNVCVYMLCMHRQSQKQIQSVEFHRSRYHLPSTTSSTSSGPCSTPANGITPCVPGARGQADGGARAAATSRHQPGGTSAGTNGDGDGSHRHYIDMDEEMKTYQL